MKITETSLRKLIKDVILENQDDLGTGNSVEDFIEICKQPANISSLGDLEKITQLKHLVDLLSKNKSVLQLSNKDSREVKRMAETITDELAPKHSAGLLIDAVLELFLNRLK